MVLGRLTHWAFDAVMSKSASFLTLPEAMCLSHVQSPRSWQESSDQQASRMSSQFEERR